jgi:hypothetical protein
MTVKDSEMMGTREGWSEKTNPICLVRSHRISYAGNLAKVRTNLRKVSLARRSQAMTGEVILRSGQLKKRTQFEGPGGT